MGFGFVVARFGLFLQQLQIQRFVPASSSGLSLWFGTALIAVGVIVNLSSAWRHVRLVHELDQNEPSCSRSLAQAVATAVFLSLIGLAMAIYLVSVRSSENIHSENNKETTMLAVTNKGILDKASNHSVDETVEKVKSILQSKSSNMHKGERALWGSVFAYQHDRAFN